MVKVRCDHAHQCRQKTCEHYFPHEPAPLGFMPSNPLKCYPDGQTCTHTRIGGYLTVKCNPVPEGAPPMERGETSGRCWKCQIRYIWKGKPRLKDAYCPGCGAKLRPTTHLFTGTTSRAKPITR